MAEKNVEVISIEEQENQPRSSNKCHLCSQALPITIKGIRSHFLFCEGANVNEKQRKCWHCGKMQPYRKSILHQARCPSAPKRPGVEAYCPRPECDRPLSVKGLQSHVAYCLPEIEDLIRRQGIPVANSTTLKRPLFSGPEEGGQLRKKAKPKCSRRLSCTMCRTVISSVDKLKEHLVSCGENSTVADENSSPQRYYRCRYCKIQHNAGLCLCSAVKMRSNKRLKFECRHCQTGSLSEAGIFRHFVDSGSCPPFKKLFEAAEEFFGKSRCSVPEAKLWPFKPITAARPAQASETKTAMASASGVTQGGRARAGANHVITSDAGTLAASAVSQDPAENAASPPLTLVISNPRSLQEDPAENAAPPDSASPRHTVPTLERGTQTMNTEVVSREAQTEAAHFEDEDEPLHCDFCHSVVESEKMLLEQHPMLCFGLKRQEKEVECSHQCGLKLPQSWEILHRFVCKKVSFRLNKKYLQDLQGLDCPNCGKTFPPRSLPFHIPECLNIKLMEQYFNDLQEIKAFKKKFPHVFIDVQQYRNSRLVKNPLFYGDLERAGLQFWLNPDGQGAPYQTPRPCQ